ncbi:hypothetical protein HYT57_05540 [Candidatus Woesearchaeota archaeon]|nr:hypothetical protein [Candidatus Woesearchaeota archaeon]
MTEHYDYVLKKTLNERIPVIWYGHPTRVFKDYPSYFDVFSQMVKTVGMSKDIWKATLGEFYNWWVKRLGFAYAVYFDGNSILVKWKTPINANLDIYYKGRFKSSPLKSKIELSGMKKMKIEIENERSQYRKSLKDIISKLKFELLNNYLNRKNM